MTRLLAAVLVLVTCRAWALDQLLPGKLGLVKPSTLVKGVFKGAFVLPDSTAGPSLRLFDTLGGAGDQTFDLSTAATIPLGPGGSKGVKFKGGPCAIVLIKANVIKYVCKTGVTLISPVIGDLAVVLTAGTTRYCALFPGATATKNTSAQFKAKDAPEPVGCAGDETTSTTTTSTTSTTIPPCTTVGGFCWFLGASGDSCDATCLTAAMTYDPATATYAGSSGSDANCMAVLGALGVSDTYMGAADCVSLGLGCFDAPGVFGGRCSSPPTSSAIGVNGYQRACACQ